MTAHRTGELRRLLAAALAAGLLAAGPALAQVRAAGPRGGGGMGRGMAGGGHRAAAPRASMGGGHRGMSAQPRGSMGGGFRSGGGFRGAFGGSHRFSGSPRHGGFPGHGTRSRGLGPSNAFIVNSGGSLLNRGAPWAVRTGHMGGNGPPFQVFSPAQLHGGSGRGFGNDFVVGGSGFHHHSGSHLFVGDDDGDFRFALHLGGGNVWVGDDPVYGPPGYWHKRGHYRRYWYPQSAYFPGTYYVNTYPWGFSSGNYYADWPVYTVDGGYVDPYVNPMGPQYVQPPAAPSEPPRQLTVPERAQRLMLSGDPRAAATVLREHARTSPDDLEAVRTLAVALLEDGEPAQAAAVMAMAYDRDPALANRPLAAPLMFRNPQDLRRAVSRAVTFANRVNTASSWLLVAALMQAEGRLDVGERMLQRAIGLGLDERVAASMRQALGG